MNSLGYHHVISLGILLQVKISIDLVYPGGCDRVSIVAGKFRRIWALPSPLIIEPIIHDNLWEGVVRITSIIFLCFIYTIFSRYTHSKIKVSKYYFVFIFFTCIFLMVFVVLQINVPWPAVTWCYALKEHKQRTLVLEGVTLNDTNLCFRSVSTSVTPSRTGWCRTRNSFMSLSPGEKQMVPSNLFLMCRIWS